MRYDSGKSKQKWIPVETAFLKTNIAPDYTFSIVAFVCTFLLIVMWVVLVRRAAIKKSKQPDVFTVMGMIPMSLTIIALFGAIAIASTVENDAAKTNEANLTKNIKEVYDIDDIKLETGTDITADGKEFSQATVYKGDTAYEVEIHQNEKTFEPTLISYDNKEHIRELKK